MKAAGEPLRSRHHHHHGLVLHRSGHRINRNAAEPASDLTDRAVVPALWLYEVVNVGEVAVRKSRITEEKAGTFLESLADLPIEIENPTRPLVFASVRALASRYKLTCYDAAYLELAIRHNLLLASLDDALAQAARAAGVDLVQL